VDLKVAVMTKSGAAGHVPEVRELFWQARMAGMVVVDACAMAGVYERTGKKWIADCGGVRPRPPVTPSGRFLSEEEREHIAIGLAEGKSKAQIARELGRPTSTVTREVARNRDWRGRYRALNAQRQAQERAKRPKPAKLVVVPALREYVQDRLSNEQWSPEQISKTLVLVFPGQPQMRVSHETIYQSLYVQSRGALKRELTACLRTGRVIRRPKRVAAARRNRIPDMVMVSERPAEVADRAVPGHWEGDLIIGLGGRSAIATLVERASRFCMLVHLPGDHGAEQVRDGLTAAIHTLPEQLRGSLTWDQGIELARHAEITLATDLDIYFCDPHSPWQRGSNENTNGLLRQYFPKGTDLRVHSPEYLTEIAARLNNRPRKTLGWRSPRMVLNEHLVATAA
jgi:IS30 family transposase